MVISHRVRACYSSLMDKHEAERLCRLIDAQRWAALATVQDDDVPYVSFVAYAVEPGKASMLLHVSRLSAHTGYALARPQVALGISAPDDAQGDPQTLPRVTLEGRVELIGRDGPEYGPARTAYLAKIPTAEQLFGFGDFVLLRIKVETLRYVGGFGRAHTVSAGRWRQWAGELGL